MIQSRLEDNYQTIKIEFILLIPLMIFVIGTFTLETFISSISIKLVYLILTLILLILYYLLSNKKVVISTVDCAWIVFYIYFFVNLIMHGNFMKISLIDLIVYFVFIMFILLSKIDSIYYFRMLKMIMIFALIYSFSAFFQYYAMDFYSNLILPMFNDSQREEIFMLYYLGNYSGFTWQTAYISGFLVCGIGLFILKFTKNKSLSEKVVILLVVLFMITALLLAGKRAHILFLVFSLLVTYLFSINIKKLPVQIIKFVTIILLILILFANFITNYTLNIETPFGKFYYRMSNTVTDFQVGNDITSGRSDLYDFAFSLFNNNPIFGVGWREFSQNSIGVIHTTAGSHPHNIYIQLLTEFGIIGFILFLVPILITLVKTIRILVISKKNSKLAISWKYPLQFSLFYQVFFVCYGMTGNLLTDHMYLLIYAIAASIAFSAIHYKNKIGEILI